MPPVCQFSFYCAAALLGLGPFVLARLGRRGRLISAATLLILFGLPILRVEYLTLIYGAELRTVYEAKAGPGSRDEPLLFSVFDHTSRSATVLLVEGASGKSVGYFLRYRRQEEWDVDIHPQAVLWSDGGSARVASPYPTAVLLLLRGVVASKC